MSRARRIGGSSFCAACLLLAAIGGGALAQTEGKPDPRVRAGVKAVPAPQADAARLRDKPGLPDIVVAGYELARNGEHLTYRVTFRNDGDGPVRCFNYLISDSRSGLEVRQVCNEGQQNWALAPGETVLVEGTVDRSELWAWPDEEGYMSMLRLRANHGTEQQEKDITNNHTHLKVIYWDQNRIQDLYR
jgi:hypothetical protein